MLYGEKRPGGGLGVAIGFVATLAVHGLVVGAVIIGRASADAHQAEPIGEFVDVKVVKFGKRDLSFLPHKQAPVVQKKPEIKLTENAEAKPLPRPPDEKKDKPDPDFKNLPTLPKAPQTDDPSTGSADEQGDPSGLRGGTDTEGRGPIYLQHLVAEVQGAWNVPTVISDDELAKLAAKVFIKIDDDGNVVEARIVKSSGNDLFDSSLAGALQTVKKFDPPPPELRARIANGINMNFHFDKQR